jgi:hypothetical protein
MMKKKLLLLVPVLLLGFLAACQSAPEITENTIIIQRNGTVIGALRESFDRDYYNPEELKDFVREKVGNYNARQGREDAVKLDFILVENQMASMNLIYAGYEDYAQFNGETLFVGSVTQALEAGHEISGDFGNRDKVVVLSEQVNVVVPGRIRSVSSEDVTVVSRNTAEIRFSGDGSEASATPLVYIIYR